MTTPNRKKRKVLERGVICVLLFLADLCDIRPLVITDTVLY